MAFLKKIKDQWKLNLPLLKKNNLNKSQDYDILLLKKSYEDLVSAFNG